MIATKEPTFKCIFCLNNNGPFCRIEHIIPESLGNDDLILPPGFVCDRCNQYFGAKLEREVLSSPPFSVERVRYSLKTKKGKASKFESDGITFYSSGHWDTAIFTGDTNAANNLLNKNYISLSQPKQFGDIIARFLLKIGIELICDSNVISPYLPIFDDARNCARYGTKSAIWNVGYGIYPRKNDLLISKREDEIGPLETRRLYEFSVGIMPNGDVGISFLFVDHYFICNISSPDLKDMIIMHNAINEFPVYGRF